MTHVLGVNPWVWFLQLDDTTCVIDIDTDVNPLARPLVMGMSSSTASS
jgi:hypothetical protein